MPVPASPRIAGIAIAAWSLLAVGAGLAYGQAGKQPSAPPAALNLPRPAAPGGLPAEDSRRFEERFAREVWPLLDRAKGGCVSCHNAASPSQLHFPEDGAGAAFKRLLAQGAFDTESPSGILARVASPLAEQRMPPPPAAPWTDSEIATLRQFVNDLYDRTHQGGTKADEQFPPELLDPYRGKPSRGGPDNTFLTYRQLRGKIRTLFGDEWKRSERDLFQENLAQFGGADFIQRFDETSIARPTFLSALNSLSKDVATRAYVCSTGPFAGRPERLPSPVGMKEPSPLYRAEIARLYRRLLFRAPTEAETRQSFAFLQHVYAATPTLSASPATLDFELSVKDDLGRSSVRAVRLQVGSGPLGLFQQFIDETAAGEEPLVRKKLDGTFTLKPKTPGQAFTLSNEETNGNVSLAGVELKGPLPEETVRRVDVTDPAVSLQGAWQRVTAAGFTSVEDGNNNKGSSEVELPLEVEKAGRYEITVLWRKAGTVQQGRGRRAFNTANATAVLAEVRSADPSRLANPALAPVPPPGEARFFVDETVDTLAYWDLKTAFRFGDGPDQGVAFANEGTRKRVVADSVKFAGEKGGEFVVDDPQAEGGWPNFVFPSFRPFNLVGGGAVTDNNQRKGEMKLLYRPAKSSEWKPDATYRVLVGFPGQVDNETQVPIVVHARESTPIIQVSAPFRAAAGAPVTLDASATYNVQRTPLQFTWVQNGGPRVKIADPHAPKLQFVAAPMGAEQAAWEGLCRALMQHPDFLFSRPRSLATVRDPKERRRLQLVKIAQDLVARPPTEAEVAQVDAGVPLARLVDRYLDSPEFREFYMHRVRLALESRGSAEDDEPVRLWSFVAFNDRPFKEILTADYTIDAELRKQPRPEYHGRTGLLTMKGFIKGKPGLPHFNYAAMVTEKFLGYVYEVPPSIVAMRDSIAAASTTSPTSACYSCHKILTPLAYQRLAWDDEGSFRPKDGDQPVDDTDRGLVPSYPFRGKGLEAFATQAVNKERFLRTMFQTHFVWYFGREMRYQQDERGLYRRLWEDAAANGYRIRSLIRTLLTSREYLEGTTTAG